MSSNERMRDVSFTCPKCRADLAVRGAGFTCGSCGSSYSVVDGIPVLVADAGGTHPAAQARWFDEQVDAEWEIERPHAGPQLHRWLLAEKFRRSVDGISLVGARALAVCAGSGMDAEFLANSGARVVAADISLGAAKRANERASRRGLDIAAVVADVEKLPFADDSFDVVYVHDGLHHVAQPLEALGEMARVARRSVSVTEPADAAVTRFAVKVGFALDREEAGNRVARLTLAEIQNVLIEHGFTVRKSSRYGMLYRHDPGLPMRLLSAPGVFASVRFAFLTLDRILGRWGNKLVVVGVKG